MLTDPRLIPVDIRSPQTLVWGQRHTMHELSIALSIIELAEEEARKAGSSVISELELEVGQLAGVDFEALEFALEMSKLNTILEHSLITINKINGIRHCIDCNTDFNTDEMVSSCPLCNGYRFKLIQGDELRIKSLTVK